MINVCIYIYISLFEEVRKDSMKIQKRRRRRQLQGQTTLDAFWKKDRGPHIASEVEKYNDVIENNVFTLDIFDDDDLILDLFDQEWCQKMLKLFPYILS